MPETLAKQLNAFLSKFAPPMAKSIRECRPAMRNLFPTANELVYDNYNFLLIAYCATERTLDCVASLAANWKGIGLHFYYGSALPDPQHILGGSGTRNPFVRLKGAATIAESEVQALLAAAAAQADPPFSALEAGR